MELKEDQIASTVFLSPNYELINIKQKHKDVLLRKVYDKEGISHSELAEEIGVSPSGLNAIVKKINEDLEPENQPLKSKKVNKFRYYSLTEIGKKYVEENLFTEEGKEYKEEIRELWRLFCGRLRQEWKEKTRELLRQYINLQKAEDENQVLFFSIMDLLINYWKKQPEDVAILLKDLISDKELRSKVENVVVNRVDECNKMMPLIQAQGADEEMAYHMIDDIFEEICNSEKDIEIKNEDFRNVKAYRTMVQKIEADILYVIMHFKDREYVRKMWLDCGLDKALAYYMAEKCHFLTWKFVKKMENAKE